MRIAESDVIAIDEGNLLNGFQGLTLNDTILFLFILLDKTVLVGQDSLSIMRPPQDRDFSVPVDLP